MRWKTILAVGCFLSVAIASWGGPIPTCVGEFTVTGAPNRDELKVALQTLLLSRLSNERIVTQEQPAGAEIIVTGSYIAIGKVFSIDAVAKGSTGAVQARAFVQGEGSDELIPAVGKLARQLADGIVKGSALVTSTPEGLTPVPAPAAALPKPQESLTQKPAAGTVQQGGAQTQWISQRLTGTFVGMALGRKTGEGRDLFLATANTLHLFRLGSELKQVADVSLGKDVIVLAIDTADIDGDGKEEIYLTIFADDNLVSQVWQVENNSLKKLAGGLPYYFRTIAMNGGKGKLYAQQMGVDDDFYGSVGELTRSATGYTLANPVKLPRFGHLYNFNRFRDKQGKELNLVIHKDGYLVVSDLDGEELWRSNDKFGGSENFFQRPDNSSTRKPDSPLRRIFLEQRIVVTSENELIVPQNSGTWVIGNNRLYNKNSVVSMNWNGAALEERTKTKESQNYLSDFSYDEQNRELTLLEIVKKEGPFGKGASVVIVRKFQ